MNLLPKEARPIEVIGATVDFFTYEKEGMIYYYFDTSLCTPPEPMVNAMAGLKMIDAKHKKLLMVNHTAPVGLFGRIDGFFKFELETLEQDNVLVTFEYIDQQSENANLNQTHCDG